jgi:hypothetical protein
MSETRTLELNRRCWDTIAASYQARPRIATDSIYWGPLAPGERELRLLENVRDIQVIEIGCGGYQNAIALAGWGATRPGTDPSPTQPSHTRRLTSQHVIGIQFAAGMAADLGEFTSCRAVDTIYPKRSRHLHLEISPEQDMLPTRIW